MVAARRPNQSSSRVVPAHHAVQDLARAAASQGRAPSTTCGGELGRPRDSAHVALALAASENSASVGGRKNSLSERRGSALADRAGLLDSAVIGAGSPVGWRRGRLCRERRHGASRPTTRSATSASEHRFGDRSCGPHRMNSWRVVGREGADRRRHGRVVGSPVAVALVRRPAASLRLNRPSGMPAGQARAHSPQSTQRPARC